MSDINLESSGILSQEPFAELLFEAVEAGLSGSFRLINEAQKIAVYLDQGRIIFAASNLKQHRLPFCLLRWKVFTGQDLAPFQGATSDLDWGTQLVAAGKLSAEDLAQMQTRQTAEIIETALGWASGNWNFSALVRAREDLRVSFNPASLLFEAARWLPAEIIEERFTSDNETFAPQAILPQLALTAEESFVLSRFDKIITLGELKLIGGLPEQILLRAIYALWLGGFVKRYNYLRVFSEEKIAKMLSAKIALSKPAVVVPAQKSEPIETAETETEIIAEKPEEKTEAPVAEEVSEEVLLERFFNRVLPAKTHYEVLDVDTKADVREIKQSYFALAKRFHPDKFHYITDSVTRNRLQEAFARVAQAHETLKDNKSRELYDFKIRKMNAENTGGNATLSHEAIFQQGVSAFESKNYETAMALFARAVSLAQQNARYRAHYAKALATNPKFRHKAEGEFQAAIKLEPRDADIRLMLVEFYRGQGFNKRAESELKKLLEFAPNNAQARRVLDSLAAK